MRTSSIVSFLAVVGMASAILLPVFDASAQTTVATDPVGYTALSLQANSDTLVSIPFTRPVAFTGAIGSISSNTLTVASSPAWTTNQYVYAAGTQSNTYYAIIGPLLTSLTGTVSVTNGSTTVTGSGFTPIVQGDELLVNGLAYNVASVTSDSALVLSRAYTGTTATGLSASYDHSPKEGSYYTVTANGSNTLTVNLNGDSLSTVATGTSVSLIPYWTLGTAFPASDAGTSYIASTSSLAFGRATQILLPDMTTAGINLAPSSFFYYYNSGWRQAGQNVSVAYNDSILLPSSYFIVRNTSSATTFTPSGGVYMNRLSVPLDTQASTSQDNAAAVARPAAVTLNDLGIVDSGAFTPSTSSLALGRKDTLLTYDNTQSGTNKAPNNIYYYYNNAWRLAGQNVNTDYGSTVIPFGTGFTVRKAATTGAVTSFWENTRNY